MADGTFKDFVDREEAQLLFEVKQIAALDDYTEMWRRVRELHELVHGHVPMGTIPSWFTPHPFCVLPEFDEVPEDDEDESTDEEVPAIH